MQLSDKHEIYGVGKPTSRSLRKVICLWSNDLWVRRKMARKTFNDSTPLFATRCRFPKPPLYLLERPNYSQLSPIILSCFDDSRLSSDSN
jgi:hypothetical protein